MDTRYLQAQPCPQLSPSPSQHCQGEQTGLGVARTWAPVVAGTGLEGGPSGAPGSGQIAGGCPCRSKLPGPGQDRREGYLPYGSVEFVQLLCGQRHLGEVIGEDLRSQVEPYIPVILHLLHAAFPGQQAAQLHAWERGVWALGSVVAGLGKAQVWATTSMWAGT